MNAKNELSKDFLDSIKKHTYYILWKCPTEEYDPKLAKVLINLKRIYFPLPQQPTHIAYHNPVNFKKIVHITHTPQSSKKVPAILGVAAAACIISVLLIGTTEHVEALPDTGFFLFLQKDKTGFLAITSPSYSETADNSETCENCRCCENCECGCNDDNY